jgi:AcrR family transcriptional regulator
LTVSPEARPPENSSPEAHSPAAQSPAAQSPGAQSPGAQSPEARSGSTRLSRPARRLQLLGAARHVFVAQGYHAAAMDEIAERAGVSKPVLYQHFPGKLELYLALLDESAEELIKIMSEALSSTTENRQRVQATFKAFYDFVAGTDEAFRLVFESDLSNEPAVRARLDRTMSDCADMVSQFIREDAGIGDAEAHLLGMALVGMAQVSARYWLSTKREIPKDMAEQLIARLGWRGISGWPRTG